MTPTPDMHEINRSAESVHAIIGRPQPLGVFFNPKTVAVIGATESAGSVGRTLLHNLMSTPFGGTVIPINPKRDSVLGLKAYSCIGAVPEKVDLAVIVTPAPTVPAIISECVEAGVPGAIIISAGFRECGAAGAALEQQVLERARGNMRLIGPNCLGVMNPCAGLNATFASAMAKPGNVGFISQSGALCTAILDWSRHEDVGFSAFVSVGSMLDVGWGDLIDYLGDDPNTESILIYMESIGDARAFLSAAREVALTKPIIVIKAGRTEAAAEAAASHTGALAGSDEVLDAAFRRCGVLRVDTIADLFSMAEVLAKQPRPRGPRLTIVTNAGGPGVLATDALLTGQGELAALSRATMDSLNQILPPHWSRHNPIDILGDADPARYAKTVEAVSEDPDSDGLLVILTPQAMTDPTRTAEQLRPYAKIGKPVLASWMGGTDVEAGRTILNSAGIPGFSYPDTAARAFNYMWRYNYNLRGLYETPTQPADSETNPPDRLLAAEIIQNARSFGRTLLTEFESKRLLAAYNIPTVETNIATDAEAAVRCAEDMGYPVVLKLLSEVITHKTEVGGVQLNLRDAGAVRKAYHCIESGVYAHAGGKRSRGGKSKSDGKSKNDRPLFRGVTVQPMVVLDGYEIIIGSSQDAQFGPVLLFGSGGQLVEVFKDRALALPPLNTTLARRMMEQTHIFKALQGIRGRPPVDLAALECLLVRFSQLVTEQRWIKEIDINPLLASPHGLMVLDARVVLHGPEVTEAQLPRLAIRPYPNQYVAEWTMRDSTPVTIRPIRPEDEPLMVKFHGTLSPQSVHFRYFHAINLSQRIAHERLVRICFNDYDREIALVADHRDAATGVHEILGVGRLIKQHGTNEAEFAIIISDQFQHRGLGSELLRRLIEIGRAEKLGRITADILPSNHDMQRVCARLGFALHYSDEDEVIKAEIVL